MRSTTEIFTVRDALRDGVQVVRSPLRVGRRIAALARTAIRDRLVPVPVRLCMDVHAFGYGEPGWHPYRSLAEELHADPRRPLEETRFARFVHRLHVSTYTDLMTFHDRALAARLPELPFGSYPWGTLEWDPVTIDPRRFHRRADWVLPRRDPWSALHAPAGGVVAERRPVELYDPPTAGSQPLQIHARKVAAILRSVEGQGYRALLGKSYPVPTVAVLARGGSAEVRYLLQDRTHFLGVLAALGCTEAWVRIDARRFPIVWEAEIDEWPWVRSGLLEREAARTLFRLYFRLDGRERARALGVAV